MFLQYFNKILANKFSLIVVFLLIFKLPITEFNHFIYLTIFIILVFNIIEFKEYIKISTVIILFFLVSLLYFFEKKTIIESHGIFLPSSQNNYIEIEENAVFLPTINNIDLYISKNYEIYSLLIKKFSFQVRISKEHLFHCLLICWVLLLQWYLFYQIED